MNITLSFIACIIEPGVIIGKGNDAINVTYKTTGPSMCSNLCAALEKCEAWTMRIDGNYCWLKSDSDNSRKTKKEGWVTGTKACGKNAG